MSNFKRLLLVSLVGLVALTLTFGFGLGHLAYILVAISGGIMSLSMFWRMIQTLREGRYGVDILAITAIIATLAVGDYWASLIILVMLTGGESLEDYASRRASRELTSLLDNTPKLAHRIVGADVEVVDVNDLQIGDIVLLRPQEMVQVDGEILDGRSDFNESSLTGESKAVEKGPGDRIMSGSLNGSDAIQFRVTATAKDSQYQQLVKLVKESQGNTAPFVRLADRYAVPFTIFAYLIGGLAWFVTKNPVRFAQVLVVASPCPLILAAPIALVAGMSQSSKEGIIVKNGTVLEKLSKLKTVAFDKTGTITQGNLQVDQVVPEGVSQEELLTYAASIEQSSSHVLAQSLVSYAQRQGIKLSPVSDIQEITAQGVQGICQDSLISVGKMALMPELSEEQKTDKTCVYVSKDGQYIGHITFSDRVRPEAKRTMEELKNLGVSHLVMLTGDRKVIADKIAQEVEITEFHADCLPQDKIYFLKAVAPDQHPVLMVGDGVNDAPALTTADIGIAMGASGSSAASESADAVILEDDLSKVVQVIKIAKHTMSIARQSVLLGLAVCLVLMLIAATGAIPTLIGALLQEVVDTVAILSALRAHSKAS